MAALNQKALKQKIDRALSRLVNEVDPKIRAKIKYAVFPGGKRIRPLTLLAATQALRGKIENGLPAACAVELIHSYSLTHDDLPCMDDADTRRGKPSCHVKFGEAEAVLIGDGLQTLAFYAIAKYTPEKSLVPRLVSELANHAGANGMVLGQALGLSSSKSPIINLKKTASLFTACAKMGAITAGANERVIKKFTLFGENLGLLFQLADDLEDSKNGLNTKFVNTALSYTRTADNAIRFLGDKRQPLMDIMNSILHRIALEI